MPRYRVVIYAASDDRGHPGRMTLAKDDDDITRQVRQFLQERRGWRAEVWQPDRKRLVATIKGPPLAS